MEDLLGFVDVLKDDAESGMVSSAPGVLSAWGSAVTAQGETEVCFSDGFETTTDE